MGGTPSVRRCDSAAARHVRRSDRVGPMDHPHGLRRPAHLQHVGWRLSDRGRADLHRSDPVCIERSPRSGGDDPAYWMSGSFDGLGFATGVVGARRFNDDGTSCEHEETWLVSLSTPAPTTMASTSAPTTTSTTTTTTHIADDQHIHHDQHLDDVRPGHVDARHPRRRLSCRRRSPPTTRLRRAARRRSSPPRARAAPTNPTVATSAPPSAAPALVATVADGQVMSRRSPPRSRPPASLPANASRRPCTRRLDCSARSPPTKAVAVRLAVTVTLDDGAGSHDVVFVGERSGTVCCPVDRNRPEACQQPAERRQHRLAAGSSSGPTRSLSRSPNLRSCSGR